MLKLEDMESSFIVNEEVLWHALRSNFKGLPYDFLANVRDENGCESLVEIEVNQENFYKHNNWGDWDSAIAKGGSSYVLSALLWQLRHDCVILRVNKVVIRFDNNPDNEYSHDSEDELE